MEYLRGLDFQARLFFQTVGLGFILGIIYDAFRFVRMLFSNRKPLVIFMDIAYFVVCAFLIFCFLLVIDNGEIRAYALFALLVGWLIYYFTLGIFVVRIIGKILKLNRSFASSVNKTVKKVAFKAKNNKKHSEN